MGVWAQVLLPCCWAALATLGFCFNFGLRPVRMITAALGGGLGWLIYIAFGNRPDDAVPYFAATIAISLYAEAMARIQRAPVIVYLAPALLPLVPGSGIYRTMIYALNGEASLCFDAGLQTLSISGALALGVVFSSSVVRLLLPQRRRGH
ncbi:MAG: threonine/serine exporter family protein [Oscillospiraceae bacterium]